MAEIGPNPYLSHPDIDEILDAAKGVLTEAGYTGANTIHPEFREWFIEELSGITGGNRNFAASVLLSAKACIQLTREIDEIESMHEMMQAEG